MDNATNIPDLKKLSLPGRSTLDLPRTNQKPPTNKSGEKFLKGPIPWRWLAKAAQLSGKAFQVGIFIWFLAGLNKNRTVALSNKALRSFGVERNAHYRGLKALERAGLVSVVRHIGRSPVVTILEVDEVAPADQDSASKTTCPNEQLCPQINTEGRE